MQHWSVVLTNTPRDLLTINTLPLRAYNSKGKKLVLFLAAMWHPLIAFISVLS